MLRRCKEGLPCWRPRPSTEAQGIVAGDVGRFSLVDGFQKLFNVWDEEIRGIWQAPVKETRVLDEHFPEGDTLTSGALSTIQRSPDRRYVQVGSVALLY